MQSNQVNTFTSMYLSLWITWWWSCRRGTEGSFRCLQETAWKISVCIKLSIQIADYTYKQDKCSAL